MIFTLSREMWSLMDQDDSGFLTVSELEKGVATFTQVTPPPLRKALLQKTECFYLFSITGVTQLISMLFVGFKNIENLLGFWQLCYLVLIAKPKGEEKRATL